MKEATILQRTISTELDPAAIPDCTDNQLGEPMLGMTSREELLDMRSERARLLTFGQEWSLKWAEELARYAFYCVNPSERNSSGRCVRCGFCGLEILYFSSPSDVKNKHIQHARVYCPFLMGTDVGIQISSSVRNGTESRTNPNARSVTGSFNGCFLHSKAQPVRKENVKHVGATPIFGSHLNAQHSVSVPCAGRRIDQPAFPPSSSVTCDLQQPPRSDQTELMPLHPSRLHHNQSSPQVLSSSLSALSLQHGNQNMESQRATSSALPPQPSSSTPLPPPHHPAQANSSPSSSSSVPQRRPMTWAYIMRTARFPEMAAFQARLESLEKTWPLSKPTPRELAKAGLFHVPSSITIIDDADHYHHSRSFPPATRVTWADSVKCFWCGERLHQWRANDDAVLEHARLSPGCRYVIQILGRELHDDVIKIASDAENNRFNSTALEHRPTSSQQSPPPTTTPSPPRTTTTTHTHEQRPPLSSTPAPAAPRHVGVDQAMESAPVRAVLEMGFSRHLIRELLSSRTLAPHQLTADYLCELALQATTTVTANPAREPPRATTSNSTSAKAGFTWTSSTSEAGTRVGPVSPSAPPLDSKVTCKVCSAAEVKVTFRPCNHLLCCSSCAGYFTSCPVCHVPITDRLTTYLA